MLTLFASIRASTSALMGVLGVSGFGWVGVTLGWCGWFGVSVSGLVTLFLEMCLCRLADTNVGAVRVYCVGWLTRCGERLKPGNSTNGVIRSCW